MINRFIPIFISFASLLIVLFFWENIKLSYDNTNNIIGEYYYKKFNPTNEILRFIIFIGVPTTIYLIFYFLINKDCLSINKNKDDFFLNKIKNEKLDPLKKTYFFLIFLIFIEFLSIDFKIFISQMDIFHHGTFLVPPMNYLISGNFFQSTIHDYGFIANNIGLIYNFFFGYYSLGAIFFTFLIFILLIKFSLILLIKKIINLCSFNNNTKVLFFIVLSLIAISLPNYYDHLKYFAPRMVLYLFFIFFLAYEICRNKEINFRFFFIGFFSVLSVLWWFDVGAYTNLLILLSILYLSIFKQFKNVSIIIASILFTWLLFYLLLPADEFKEFLFQLKLVYSKSYQYLLGIEYKKPFTENSGRWTKALMIIYFSSIMLIHFNFDKKLNLDSRLKVYLNIFFIGGIFSFQSALMRSDSAHIKYSSGIYTIIFIFLILFFSINFLINKKPFEKLFKNFNLKNKISYILLSATILYFSGLGNYNNFDKNYYKNLNIFNFKQNISNLLLAEDDAYLDDNIKSVLTKYKELTINDSCIQILTDDVSFPYLLKKQTCTQSYIPAAIITDSLEKKFISQLKESNPAIILYDSTSNLLLNKLNMPIITEFVNRNYRFFENYNGFIFYKKK